MFCGVLSFIYDFYRCVSNLLSLFALIDCYFHWICIWCIRIALLRGSKAILSIGQWIDLCRSTLCVETLATYRIDCGVMRVNQSEHVDDEILFVFFEIVDETLFNEVQICFCTFDYKLRKRSRRWYFLIRHNLVFKMLVSNSTCLVCASSRVFNISYLISLIRVRCIRFSRARDRNLCLRFDTCCCIE